MIFYAELERFSKTEIIDNFYTTYSTRIEVGHNFEVRLNWGDDPAIFTIRKATYETYEEAEIIYQEFGSLSDLLNGRGLGAAMLLGLVNDREAYIIKEILIGRYDNHHLLIDDFKHPEDQMNE